MTAAVRPVREQPRLAGVVVHWRNEEDLRRLLAAWPRDPALELVVVDNGGGAGVLPEGAGSAGVRWVRPGRNLGFAGGVNAGVAASRAPAILLLNPDVLPEPGAVEVLADGLDAHPEAVGVAPRLVGEDGVGQYRWQLRTLPGLGRLLAQCLFLPAGGGLAAEPPPGAEVEQPAAAVLLVRRQALAAVGGLDERFHPAWFEDVDLARRLAERGAKLLYWPHATFRHGLGSSVPRLGYGRFLWVYYRNLVRYLAKHHGRLPALAARVLLAPAALLRAVALPLRRPRRASSRGEAVRGLLTLAGAALTGWRSPKAWVREMAPEAAGAAEGEAS